MLCLNLGSYVDVIEGEHWLNMDILPLQDRLPQGVQFQQHDLRRGLPQFGNSSVDVIRASHIIEHLSLEDAAMLVRECYRVLIPQGIFRVSVPNGDTIISHYIADDMAWFDNIQPKEYLEAKTQGEKLSRMLFSGDNAHRAIYNSEMMGCLLSKAGFKAIAMLPGWSHSKIIEQETKDQHIKESLIMEGVK